MAVAMQDGLGCSGAVFSGQTLEHRARAGGAHPDAAGEDDERAEAGPLGDLLLLAVGPVDAHRHAAVAQQPRHQPARPAARFPVRVTDAGFGGHPGGGRHSEPHSSSLAPPLSLGSGMRVLRSRHRKPAALSLNPTPVQVSEPIQRAKGYHHTELSSLNASSGGVQGWQERCGARLP